MDFYARLGKVIIIFFIRGFEMIDLVLYWLGIKYNFIGFIKSNLFEDLLKEKIKLIYYIFNSNCYIKIEHTLHKFKLYLQVSKLIF